MGQALPRRNKTTDTPNAGVLLDPCLTGESAQFLAHSLEQLVVGQPEARAQIVSAYQTFRSGLAAPNRPLANFLFLGPTGTGKTRTVEALAETLAGTSKAVLKIDCGEFQHSQDIAKLVGSPPGYLGHRETMPLLGQENVNYARNHFGAEFSLVLFDEIEKASDAVWNLLLGILDKATLSLGDNRRVDFSKCMIFLTSNLGAREMESIASPKLGFANPNVEAPDAERLARSATEAARRRFTAEFMNRLDKVVVFRPLDEESLARVLELELGFVQRRVLETESNAFVFTVSEAAKQRIIRLGTGARYGARDLKRVLERELVQPLANLVATSQARLGDWIQVDADPGSDTALCFRRECAGLSFQEMKNSNGTHSTAISMPARSAAATTEYVMSQAAVRARR
jgi:ATP-dependent Clp protease ATP-binding subunit ClpB